MRRSWLALGLAAVLLLAVGVAIGRRSAGSEQNSRPSATVTVSAEDADRKAPDQLRRQRRTPGSRSAFPRTRRGAVAAATAYVGALSGSAILDPVAVRRTVTAIASADSRDDLVRAYERAAAQISAQLGVGTSPEPIVIVRAAPVGYRVDRFDGGSATVSIWRVGIVGSGATVEPRQTWRTETVSLVWEATTWRVAALRSSAGPTPPLADPTATSPAELFATIPDFEEPSPELP